MIEEYPGKDSERCLAAENIRALCTICFLLPGMKERFSQGTSRTAVPRFGRWSGVNLLFTVKQSTSLYG